MDLPEQPADRESSSERVRRQLEALVIDSRDKFSAMLRRRLPPGMEADDAINNACVNILERCSRVPENFAAFFFTVASNSARDAGRRKSCEKEKLASATLAAKAPFHELPAGSLESIDERQKTRMILGRLPEESRALLVSFYFDDPPCSLHEYAEKSGITYETAKKRLQKARSLFESAYIESHSAYAAIAWKAGVK